MGLGLPVIFGKTLPAWRRMRGSHHEGFFKRCLLLANIHTNWLSLRHRFRTELVFIERHDGLRLISDPVWAGHLLLQWLAWLVRAWRSCYHTAASRLLLSSIGCLVGSLRMQVIIWTRACARGADAFYDFWRRLINAMYSVWFVPEPVKPCVQLAWLPNRLRCCRRGRCHRTCMLHLRGIWLHGQVDSKLRLTWITRIMILLLHFLGSTDVIKL